MTPWRWVWLVLAVYLASSPWRVPTIDWAILVSIVAAIAAAAVSAYAASEAAQVQQDVERFNR